MGAMPFEIIAREGELAAVEAFLERPTHGPRALVIEGGAGIGKSTLWLAGVAAARDHSLRVLTSQPAETERTLANVVLGDLFADVSAEVLATLPVPRRRAFETALRLREAPDVPVDPLALGAAILTLLTRLADGVPLVLAIDDDQWCDASSVANLGFALRRMERQPILLLLARRVENGPTTGLEEMVSSEVERLRVGPMSSGAMQLMVRQRLGIAVPRPVLLRIHEVSAGNPFYALELARAHSVEPPRDATTPLVVPLSLDRLVDARLGTFDARTLQALLLIAAHGRLPIGLFHQLEIAPDAIEPALATKVIEKSEGVVRFAHPLLASAIYQRADGADRRAAHRRLATVIDDPVPRGRHLGLSADKPDQELAGALESAMSAAQDRGLPMAAAELGEHAMRLTPADAVDHRQRRALATARAYWAAGEGARSREIAADLVAAAPAGRRRAEALVLRSELEAPPVRLALLRDALEQAADAPDLQSAIHAGLADAYFSSMRDRAWAERHLRASLRLADELRDDALRANALSLLAVVRFDGGDPHALEKAERGYRLGRRLADARLIRWGGEAVGHVLTFLGDADAAREWLERQLTEWGDRDERRRSNFLWYLTLVELWSGRWGIAREYADQLHEISVQYGLDVPYESFPPAFVALHLGQFAIAREHARHALSVGGGQHLEFYHAILAVSDSWTRSPEEGLAHFTRAEHEAAAIGYAEPSYLWWRAEFVEALLQLGRVEDAKRLTIAWETAALRLGRERVLAQAVRCRGLIAAASGDLPEAIARFEEAVRRHEAVGDPFGRARALLGLGVARRRTRQKRTARAALESALAGFEALGARTWIGVARDELARIGGRQRIAGLSPSELSVATLVAEGRTNREIAAVLFLGERTVASHLTHIYAKLGVRSRTELARVPLPPLPHAATSAGDPS